MKSAEIRKTFLEFFKSKAHHIVPSAPMVVKDDPTLMFTNAGMNQFKDIFLGNASIKHQRVADTQKCLRVSGKHNDLEEVGHDSYHHTMFEMLGNWSFGDYFKKEAISFAWELLTEKYGINKDNLYVTVFGGDPGDNIPEDSEAYNFWKELIDEDRILYGSKKDNFWEMGDTGPCGPCSEIHVDIRTEKEKREVAGKDLVNKDHPLVIEIWNLVFIQYNRTANGKLIQLPARHVDTGLGFERLCMVLQEKTSNYDTDVFQPLISKLQSLSGFTYGHDEKKDIAMRVCSDHIRAVAFAITDGQLPSNSGAGYVIRRILRRAVRYGYTFLEFKEPFMNQLLPVLTDVMGEIFTELSTQQEMVRKVITEEEISFMRTLEQGIRLFEEYIATGGKKLKYLDAGEAGHNIDKKVINGQFAFELYDTYGFPIDLTRLMAREKGWSVDMEGFKEGLQAQKERSRKAAKVETADWTVVRDVPDETSFVGYDRLEAKAGIVKYRKVSAKKKEFYEVVLTQTPFYAEAGGQVGDRGFLVNGDKKIAVINTKKEHNLIIHVTESIPDEPGNEVLAVVDALKRNLTANNHSATHLMHRALKIVLGEHVEQKGSLVEPKRLRFDFSHYTKMTEEEIRRVEHIVNDKIRENIAITEEREVPFDEANQKGAVALFGEKYGEKVRVISFDPEFSVELCGGTHVNATGQIGFFKITSEGAIAAGVRRIEAVTAKEAEDYVNAQQDKLRKLWDILKQPKDMLKAAEKIMEENNKLQKELEGLKKKRVEDLATQLKNHIQEINGVNYLAVQPDLDVGEARDLAFSLKRETDRLFLLIGTSEGNKANLTLMISEDLVKEKNLHAGNIVRELAKEISGGGGGQPHFATAGGKNPSGIPAALKKSKDYFQPAE